ncbi:MAG: hypothetical protein PGN34_12505 [Methylobacterium frigidaeris]
MIVRRIVAAGCLAAALLAAGLASAAAAQRSGDARGVDALITRFEAEDARCALPPSVMTTQACEDRERDERRLARAGWCRDAGGWNRCPGAPAVARARPRPHGGHRRARG